MMYGYARVSTDGQSLDAQVDELKAAGCQQVFQEKVSGGRRSDRRGLARVMAKLGKGDTLVVCRLDRLARSSRDLLNLLHEARVLDLESHLGRRSKPLVDHRSLARWRSTADRALQEAWRDCGRKRPT
jgi:DNA invertase Pin-like site-specific DNA recombinase